MIFRQTSPPLIGWVARLASKRSLVAKHLVKALALRLKIKIQRTCPLTPINIEGKWNATSDIPSWWFGSNPAYKCDTDTDLLSLFNPMFSLLHKNSWIVFRLNCKVAMCMISALRTKPFALDDWRRLPKVGRHVGKIGAHVSDLLGVDPYLDHTPFQTRVCCLTGFAQQIQTGFYGRG
jgi:hypothetical protein